MGNAAQLNQLTDLRGKTAVIVGVGGVGTQIAERANGFGMTIIGVDPKDAAPSPAVKQMVKPNQLDTVLPLADCRLYHRARNRCNQRNDRRNSIP